MINVEHSARLQTHTHLDTCSCLQFAQTADERPAAGWDVGDFGDGLHPLGTSDTYLKKRGFIVIYTFRGAI